MAVGKSSIKRAMESTGASKGIPVKKAEAKEVLKAAVKKTQTETVAKKSVITGTSPQVFATISQDEGINAHYGLNTPLPTFLL